MHDLIRDMGREIIRQVSPLELGKRSRLWFHEDVLEVLIQNTGNENIEGILLDLPKPQVVHWSEKFHQRILARNCKSLTSESSSILWSQAFKEVHRLQVRMPAKKFPVWFDHNNKGETLSFWFRQKFPIVAAAFSFRNLNQLENEILSQSSGVNLDIHVYIKFSKIE
ncbi:hypothetical protein L6164_012259 [Bauhinia variegata]|uniref:Uncharacterized protein n=1 Tax=Bauhinia variegata TaxID=167791 RepID=A0ACB9P9B5_BAUVA|nr:hypothetical protein L6164_012259 [Bauhinia variegata]